jgi:hypothetical protein
LTTRFTKNPKCNISRVRWKSCCSTWTDGRPDWQMWWGLNSHFVLWTHLKCVAYVHFSICLHGVLLNALQRHLSFVLYSKLDLPQADSCSVFRQLFPQYPSDYTHLSPDGGSRTTFRISFCIIHTMRIFTINVSTKNSLHKIQFRTNIKTPTCFGTGEPSSESYRTKECKPKTLQNQITALVLLHIGLNIFLCSIIPWGWHPNAETCGSFNIRYELYFIKCFVF